MTILFWPGFLTKKFINLIKHAEDGILDLNKAAETLEVIISQSIACVFSHRRLFSLISSIFLFFF